MPFLPLPNYLACSFPRKERNRAGIPLTPALMDFTSKGTRKHRSTRTDCFIRSDNQLVLFQGAVMSRSRGYLEAERKLKAATNNRLRSYWQGRMRHIESGSIDGGSDVTESNDATSNYAENEEKGITNFESDGYESIHDEAVSSDFRSDLLESLDMIGHGSFAASGPLADINPGLYVEGLGKIGLPLSERDAKALALVCNRAPFGKGSETFVDTAVRKTWEVNPDKVRFRNSKWQSQVDHAVIKVTEGLGIIGGPGTVRAELHKLLLYESGAFFDTHRE